MLALVVVLFVSWLLILKWKRRHLDKLYEKLKISAPSLPVIGHLYLLLTSEREIMKRWEALARSAIEAGGVNGFWFAHKLFVHVADPLAADVILKNCLEKAEAVKCFHFAIGDGSIFSPVKTWRRRRKLLNPAFGMVNLNRFVKIFSEQSGILVEKMQTNLSTNPISMWKTYLLYNMDSILESLGIQVNAQRNNHHPFLVALEETLKIVADRLFKPWLHNDFLYKLLPQYRTWLRRHKDIVLDFINKIIQDKKELINNNNNAELKKDNHVKTFVELMLESESIASDVAIREECLVIIGGASETTAITLGFASVLFAKYPEMQEKVYNELREVIGDVNRPVVHEDLPHLKYLEAFLRETLRLYPTIPLVVRKIEKSIDIPSGVTLVPGCGAAINIWAINRNPAYWGEDAEEFRPERFLDSTPRHPAAFATFSLGPRNCIGYKYAMMSMKTVLATILQDFRFLPASDDLRKWQRLRVKFELVLRHADDYVVRIEARK